MSLGLIPIFSPEGAGAFEGLGEALAQDLAALEELAYSAGLTPLSAFADQRDIPEDFTGDPEELDELLGPCTDWFDPALGADAVDALRASIDSRAGRAVAFEEIEGVIEELEALAACLRRAALGGAKFRLVFA